MRPLALAGALCLLALVSTIPARAESAAEMDTIRVTATWAPLPSGSVPGSVTVLDGAALRRRGAADLRSALALVSGVEAVPGGDAGPAGSVPALWGLREFDAFLLVVDGIPWGGAFIPSLTTLDLNDVERIEVLRGPAPITYGSTSFVGVIHVIHRAAGQGLGSVEVGGGSFGTVRGAAAFDVSERGRVSVDGARERFADEDAGVDRGHVRARWTLPRGIHVDADAVVLNQDPNSPHPRAGASLDPAIPLDANHNPQDAKLNTNRFQLSARQSTSLLNWVLAVSHAEDDNVRGFLEEDATDDGASSNANGYTQDRDLTEFYGGVHRRFAPSADAGLTVGADLLFGEGKQNSRNFRYYAPLDGRRSQRSADGTTVEETEFEAERAFLGVFAETNWHPAPAWTVIAGVRFHDVEETREGETEEGGMEVPAKVKDTQTRLGGRVGAVWRAWSSDRDQLSLYVDARDTFKPAAIDFGPEAEVDPLDPETARNVEIGARTDLAAGRLHVEVSAFRMDFENLVVATIVDGNPALENAGTERFDGVELDAELELTREWRCLATYSWHEATCLDYEQDFGGTLTRLDGNTLEMSPHHLASAGLAYTGPTIHAEVFANFVGKRWMNKRNTAEADAYATIDASAGTRVGRVDVRVTGRNLTDRRDPVAESELGEAQFYRLPARAVEASASVSL